MDDQQLKACYKPEAFIPLQWNILFKFLQTCSTLLQIVGSVFISTRFEVPEKRHFWHLSIRTRKVATFTVRDKVSQFKHFLFHCCNQSMTKKVFKNSNFFILFKPKCQVSIISVSSFVAGIVTFRLNSENSGARCHGEGYFCEVWYAMSSHAQYYVNTLSSVSVFKMLDLRANNLLLLLSPIYAAPLFAPSFFLHHLISNVCVDPWCVETVITYLLNEVWRKAGRSIMILDAYFCVMTLSSAFLYLLLFSLLPYEASPESPTECFASFFRASCLNVSLIYISCVRRVNSSILGAVELRWFLALHFQYHAAVQDGVLSLYSISYNYVPLAFTGRRDSFKTP